MRTRILPVAAAAVLFMTAVLSAHHSVAGAYDTKREVTIEGIVTEVRFVNPHPFLLIEVRDESGKMQHWSVEIDTRKELKDIGFNETTVMPRDHVIIKGYPDRVYGQSLYARRLDRPADGFFYEQIGVHPSIGRVAHAPAR